jgi:hypothetical protein
MSHYDGIDLLVFQMPMGIIPWYKTVPVEGVKLMMGILARVKSGTDKPVAAVVNHIIYGSHLDLGYVAQDICDKAGIPLYYSSQAAAAALARFVKYCERSKVVLKGQSRHG